MLSTVHFVITTLLAIVCVKTMGVSQGDIPVLALAIPALWLLPRKGWVGLALLVGVVAYGITLPHQPIELSVTQWVLFPLLMVMFSKRSSKITLGVMVSIVFMLEVGIMASQFVGSLEGNPLITAVQVVAIILIWWASKHKSTSNQKSWWALGLIVPLWIAGLPHAILVALSLTGIVSSIDFLSRIKNFRWGKLIYWTVPSVGFAALVVSPKVDVPHSVLIVWMCLLGTAWATDYILRSMDAEKQAST